MCVRLGTDKYNSKRAPLTPDMDPERSFFVVMFPFISNPERLRLEIAFVSREFGKGLPWPKVRLFYPCMGFTTFSLLRIRGKDSS